jgi:hypothetical protein
MEVGQLLGYPQWETDRLYLSLFSADLLDTVEMRHNVTTYEQDSAKFDREKTFLQELKEIIVPTLQLSGFTQLGYRVKYLLPVEMSYQAASSIVDLKCFSQQEKLRSFLPPITDASVRWDAEEPPFIYIVSITSSRRQDMAQALEINNQRLLKRGMKIEAFAQLLNAFPEVAIMIDIDFVQAARHIPVGEMEPFFEAAKKKTSSLAAHLADYLLET